MSDNASSSRYVQIYVNSSIASGIAALILDVLLLTFIKSRAQAFCSAANVYLVYDKREAICPRKSRLGSFTGGPVGPLQLSRFFSLLIVISTACVIILGFSINGKTIKRYEEQMFRSVVRITGRPIDIDFKREFRAKGNASTLIRNTTGTEDLVSKRLVAISDSFSCTESNYTHSRLYAFAFRESYLDEGMIALKERTPNAECVNTPTFKKSIISREYNLNLPQGSRSKCVFNKVVPAFGENDIHGNASFEMSECDVDVKWLRCFRNGRTACAGITRGKGTSSRKAYIVLIPNILYRDVVDISRANKTLNISDQIRVASNVAFFSATGFGGSVSNLANMAITDILHDQKLERLVGSEEISELDLRIFVPVLSLVAGTTTLLAISSTVVWITVVYVIKIQHVFHNCRSTAACRSK